MHFHVRAASVLIFAHLVLAAPEAKNTSDTVVADNGCDLVRSKAKFLDAKCVSTQNVLSCSGAENLCLQTFNEKRSQTTNSAIDQANKDECSTKSSDEKCIRTVQCCPRD